LANDPSSKRGAAILQKEERLAGLFDGPKDIEQLKLEVKNA